MKKMMLVGWLLIATIVVQAQSSATGLAKVQKVNGVEVYFLNKPTRTYEVVLNRKSGLKAGSIFSQGLVNESISDRVARLVKRAKRKAERKEKDWDAILYEGGKQVQIIRFTEAASPQTQQIAQVGEIKNTKVYILAEPLQTYQVVNSKTSGIKLLSYLTNGLVNHSIERDITRMAKKVNKKDTVDAVVYSAGKKAAGVKFN